jgi:CheY-like chemotaxis protein
MDSISPSTAAPSILVVEDDAEAREAIVHTLTQAGYEAVQASSGEAALDLMATAEFDGLYCTMSSPAGPTVGRSAPPSASSGLTVRWSMPPRFPCRQRKI